MGVLLHGPLNQAYSRVSCPELHIQVRHMPGVVPLKSIFTLFQVLLNGRPQETDLVCSDGPHHIGIDSEINMDQDVPHRHHLPAEATWQWLNRSGPSSANPPVIRE